MNKNHDITEEQQQQWDTMRAVLVERLRLEHAEESEWVTALDHHNAQCDYCTSKAIYDAQTINGFWAFVCDTHFSQHTHKRLGLGFGQRLIPIDNNNNN